MSPLDATALRDEKSVFQLLGDEELDDQVNLTELRVTRLLEKFDRLERRLADQAGAFPAPVSKSR